MLDNFATEYPQYKDRGYEIAGFVWWQGHKDGGNAVHAGRYEQNLVHLIKTLRQEFKAPQAPFVVATIGFGGWKMEGNQLTVANAQLAVSGDKGKYPEFAGNVKPATSGATRRSRLEIKASITTATPRRTARRRRAGPGNGETA